jgi:hypothetical protein
MVQSDIIIVKIFFIGTTKLVIKVHNGKSTSLQGGTRHRIKWLQMSKIHFAKRHRQGFSN